MPEDSPQAPVTTPEQSSFIHLGEEYGTAKKNLPPLVIVLLSIAAVGIVLSLYVFTHRAHSEAIGTITSLASVEVTGQDMTMVAVNVWLRNRGEKRYWIKTIRAELETPQGRFSDEAASAVDFPRYFEAFPPLKQNSLKPLIPETIINAGDSASGTAIFSFPVPADKFTQRKSLTVTIQPYDGVALSLAAK